MLVGGCSHPPVPSVVVVVVVVVVVEEVGGEVVGVVVEAGGGAVVVVVVEVVEVEVVEVEVEVEVAAMDVVDSGTLAVVGEASASVAAGAATNEVGEGARVVAGMAAETDSARLP